jgi:NADPH:quinone reductase-like Zn-dependent oxidoreductase
LVSTLVFISLNRWIYWVSLLDTVLYSFFFFIFLFYCLKCLVVGEGCQNINDFKIADEVFGMFDGLQNKEGAYAEYIKVSKEEISHKPSNCSFEESASLALVSLTAYKALVEIGNITKEQDILINGCSGGVGSVAVQIAKSLGCKVTGICSTDSVEFVKGLGVDKVIDYKKESILNTKNRYDVIFDCVGNLGFFGSKQLLRLKGIYVTTDVKPSSMLLSPLVNIVSSKKFKLVIVKPNASHLNIIKTMAENSQIKAQISKVFGFQEIREAHTMAENGGFRGKLVLRVGE